MTNSARFFAAATCLAVPLFAGLYSVAQDSAGFTASTTQPATSQPATRPAIEGYDRFAGGLIGSKHDFSQNGALGHDLCLPCHTPHLTAPQFTGRAPQPPPRLEGYAGLDMQLDAASLMCLSCHDGVVASDVFAEAHAMTWWDRSAGGVTPGARRLTSHPVGVSYPIADRAYHAPSVVSSGGVPLPAGRVQCTSCHDPHNTQRHPGMLVISNERSRLCLTCHNL